MNTAASFGEVRGAYAERGICAMEVGEMKVMKWRGKWVLEFGWFRAPPAHPRRRI